MKLYTRDGDEGSAELPGGPRRSKGDIRFEALGTIDELNSVLGWCLAAVDEADPLRPPLRWVQERLMVLAAELAVVAAGESAQPPPVQLVQADVDRLETCIEEAVREAPMPSHFVLPGGCEAASRLHVARCVCRRTERAVVRCLETAGAQCPLLRSFLNRLSDALFAWALAANHRAGVPERPWPGR